MNIFVLDENPRLAAQYHCDKHVVKMVLETAQILSTVSGLGPYKATHHKHPCVLWTGTNQANFNWLVELGLELSAEYTHRYDKTHKSEAVIRLCSAYDKLLEGERTQFKQCMPTHLIAYKDPVLGYRRYYNREKAYFCTWKRRDKPKWFGEDL